MRSRARAALICCLLLAPALPATAGGRAEDEAALAYGGRLAEQAAPVDEAQPGQAYPHPAKLRHARGFRVSYEGGVKYVTVLDPWPGAEGGITYALVERGSVPPADVPPGRVIEIPLRSIVTLSATYLVELEMLGLEDKIVGHGDLHRVYSPRIRALAARGAVAEVGAAAGGVNIERLLDLDPDLIMAYGLGNAYDVHPKLAEVGLKVVINADWLEATPLGRSEWIKFLALFFNKEQEAEQTFSQIEAEYRRLASLARGAERRPSVFLDSPFQDTWWMAGGGSYMATLLSDAGAEYLWEVDGRFSSLPLDFETVYERAAGAEFWLNPGDWQSLNHALALDERFAAFSAFENRRVYNNTARRGEGGGNDYWESGPAEPQLLLADLIAIFHPGLLPQHRLRYYQRLEQEGPGGGE
jgi:iron complex transport system substrate-binding protein